MDLLHTDISQESGQIGAWVPEEHERSLYLDLMKKVLLNFIYGQVEEKPFTSSRVLFWRWLGFALHACGFRISWRKPYDPRKRLIGSGWPHVAHTMIGIKRLENIEYCVREVLKHNVPGDLIEAGVWRGGGTIFMRAVLKAFNVTDRLVWVADSFQGLPPPNAKKYPADAGSKAHARRRLRITQEQVQDNFKIYGLLDDQVRFLKGWFCDTLPSAPIQKLAVVRLDGDMYGSTIEGLENLYPKLSIGGYLIVDDYGALSSCKKAVSDYRKAHGIAEEIIPIDWTGVYWKRTS